MKQQPYGFFVTLIINWIFLSFSCFPSTCCSNFQYLLKINNVDYLERNKLVSTYKLTMKTTDWNFLLLCIFKMLTQTVTFNDATKRCDDIFYSKYYAVGTVEPGRECLLRKWIWNLGKDSSDWKEACCYGVLRFSSF